jgi:hypothetical protein
MCKVLNKHTGGSRADAMYIGRGSKWANPFRIGIDGDRAAVIAKYESWLRNQHHLLRALDELRATICCAFARQKLVMAICCYGLPTLRANSASRGGARVPHIVIGRC